MSVSLNMTCITIRTGVCKEEIVRAITSWLLFWPPYPFTQTQLILCVLAVKVKMCFAL